MGKNLTVKNLSERFKNLDAQELVHSMVCKNPAGKIALVSSFGAESVVLLHMVAEANPATRVIFIDTGRLFGETFKYRDHLVELLGLTNVVTAKAEPEQVRALDPDRMLFSRDTNRCCEFRKVDPLTKALGGFDAWISGRKRYQGHSRDALEIFEDEGSHVKINPLIGWDKSTIDRYRDQYELPRHPLEADGFLSIGCMPCTARVAPGEDERSGRWKGMDKTECGIHMRHKTAALAVRP